MEAFFNHSVKEELSFFRHTYEGKDDMPAHLKSSILGCQLTKPVQQGKLALGRVSCSANTEIMVEDEQLLPHYKGSQPNPYYKWHNLC